MTAPTSFTAALLMGGQSRRMGRDKAYLRHPVSGRPSWEHLTRLLELLEPRERLFSLRHHQPSPHLDGIWKAVVDPVENAGPLGGIAACLSAALSNHVLVLAVDLIQMEATPLQALIDVAQPGKGVIFRHGSHYEPLAALYPKEAAGSASAFLHQGGRRVQSWVQGRVAGGQLEVMDLPRHFKRCYLNINDSRDYQTLTHPEPDA